jgi:ABC-2 type transport system ATP-binding protein
MSSTPAVAIQNLVKRYADGVDALKGISFSIAPGEFFGFLGPNGAGKTTTINLITGLARLSGGSISVFGHDVVRDYQAARRLIGLAAQEPNFDPFFSIEKVLIFQAGYYGLPRAQAKSRAEQLLKRFDLWKHRSKTPRQISGGMKRRLLIAKALVHDPKILILDEPTAGVDVELRHDLWTFLRELNEEGRTILLTTHYIEEAELLCNRIGIINQGQMKAIEEKASLMAKLAEKKIIVRLPHLPEPARRALADIPGLTVGQSSVSFAADDITQRLRTVTAILDRHHLAISDLDVEAFNLEDIFVQLTEQS